MSAHAIFAPSSAARWLHCPKSVEIAAALPNPESEASIEGTRVHKLIEDAIKGAPRHHEESEEVAYSVELVLDFVKKLRGPEYIKAETKVVLSEHCWGTVDILQTSPVITTILDYKNGAMDVPADRNMQLMTYAAGTLETYGPSKYYRLVIVQPNSRTAGDQPDVKQAIVTLEQVEEHREKVLDAIHRLLVGGEAPQPGRHCRYCPAFGNCPATREMLPFILTAITLTPSEVPSETAVRVMRILKGLEDFRKGLERDVMRRFAAGETVPEAYVGTTSAHRKWADDRAAVAKLMELYGAAGVDPISPAAAERMGAAGKELAKTLAFKPPGNATLKY